MSSRSDHLIERAAALLRSNQASQVPEAAKPVSVAPAYLLPPAAPIPEANALSRPFEPIRLLDTNASPRLEGFAVASTANPGVADLVPDEFPGPVPSPGFPTRPAFGPVETLATTTTGQGPAERQSTQNPQDDANAERLGYRNHQDRVSVAARPNPGNIPFVSPVALQKTGIVQLDALERAGMVVARTTRTRISEEYRIAIGRILRLLHEPSNDQAIRNVVMVTSARPGEGKSFTALNLAGSIAQNGTDPVLLVDVDPKIKPLSDLLGLGEAQGFLDLVANPSLTPEDLLRTTAIPNLAVLPVGTRLGGAAQTVGGIASMRPIIPTVTRLARRFPKHLILLDAPPCLSTSDPHTLAPHVAQVVLVVEAERTQRNEVEAAVDLVRVCPNITLLLNKVRMTTSHTFGAYDYFGSYT